MSSLDYVEVSGSDKAYIYEGRPVYVDKYKVNSKDYPAFRLTGNSLVPPASKLCTFGGCIDSERAPKTASNRAIPGRGASACGPRRPTVFRHGPMGLNPGDGNFQSI